MKIFGFGSKKGESPLGSSISPGRDSGRRIHFQPGYRIRDKDLGKIHKAAIVGKIAKRTMSTRGGCDLTTETKVNSSRLDINAKKRSVQLFCSSMVPTQMSWMSVETPLSTTLSFARIYHSQQRTRYISINFIYKIFVKHFFSLQLFYL
uniref:Uncharacterized protein n=1 Tax=Bos indicus x Bos taurus TaxID=30522 RepID=A0A4W2DPW3_BOBOX